MSFSRWLSAVCVILLVEGSLQAQSPVTVTVYTKSPEVTIPPDFSGLSIETGSLRNGNAGVYGNWMDDSTHSPDPLHAQMITLFNNLGIRNIRVGGGSVDGNNIIPTNGDIDAFFRFVEATHCDVIYSLRLLYGDTVTDDSIAKYVWGNYHQYLQTLAIGNEPDWPSYRDSTGLITGYPSYLYQWELFDSAVVAAVPGAKFGGPDQGSNYPIPGARNTDYNGKPWDVDFMNDTKSLGNVVAIYLHNYVGQGASGSTPQEMADAMLSPVWDTTYYQELYQSDCLPVLQAGLPYRLTESNSFSGGVAGGSDSYATSLFALDYMFWWAAHDASGVNFHNKQWVLNDTIYMDSNGNYLIHPMGYGIAAFNISGHGALDSVTVANPTLLNLTAYATTDSAGQMFVTIINKEHVSGRPYAPQPRDAEVTILANGSPDTASVMFLRAPGDNVLDTGGMTLGGSTISNTRPFVGRWSPIDTVESGDYVLKVPYATAAVVRIGGPFIALGVPASIAPRGVTGVPRMTTFNWDPSSGATSYRLQISTGAEFRSTVFDTTLTDTTTQLSGPLSDTTEYYWRVRGQDSLYTSAYSAVDSFTTGTGVLSINEVGVIPEEFSLLQNFPNPFNPSTVIKYDLPKSQMVTLRIYNVLGQLVETLVDAQQRPGYYEVTFNGDRLASGMYFYVLRTNDFNAVHKMLLLK